MFITLPKNLVQFHIAPDHGMEDYEACKKFDIPTFCPVDEFGIFTLEVGEPTFEAQYRLEQFTLSRSEWCISHRRSWGVPIPIFYESETDVPLLTDSAVEYIIEIFKNMDQGNDTMDNVWFDSGVSWTFILKQTKKKDFKTISDLYLEGSDQHHGWFQSSLLMISGTVIKGGKNKPAYGVDVLRLWVASLEYVNDIYIYVNIVNYIMSQVGENIQKYRNTARFILVLYFAEEIYGNYKNIRHKEYDSIFKLGCYDLHLRSEVNQLLEAARKDKIIRKILQNYYIYYKIMI
ncbi:unnamed protein product [Rhizophagus irregularis]|uniref:Aminoacyl-tRNA synthetase class Ia domain-containing protein n=1 Tax=Rhizophagus irregularis TaxID=588596 RepID=A0A916E3F3_9GLOM|nr:unnamed protein product [Rhizophagus irregularis]